MEEEKMKGNRSPSSFTVFPGIIPSYGTKFNQLLDKFVGGADEWDTKSSHGLRQWTMDR
jgi:hypothetical protein